MAACPACGYENRDGAKFCSECGHALSAAAPSLREERKVVTVLFADLVGFTSQAEKLDPEEVRAVLAPYHAQLREQLERFGGTVEKFIGDAVMALFGAPLAHEDDPERAVRAGLRIRDVLAEEGRLHVRIGITTGEALVALGARPNEGEGMAAGDVVNTAARLQAAAPTDGILVDEPTYRATRDVIDYAAFDSIEAKGKAERIVVWKAVAARARFGVDVAARGRADLVGRRAEHSLLLDALARVRRDGEPQLVTITGVPGIGKSRLVYELFKAVETGTELTYWRQGRCLPYGDGVTFWALAEIAKSHAGILETDSADAAEEKIRRAAREALGEEAEAEWLLRHLRPLVGLGAEHELAGDRRGESFAAWRRLFEALAERYPLVLVVEDLQWADAGLLDFLEELVRRVSGVPLLVLCTTRPELFESRPAWGGGGLNAVTVALSPLDDAETAQLVQTLVARAALRPDVHAELLARAGGNPLYAEEFARMAAELGADGDVPVPESVQGIIAARLDLLPPEVKNLLQSAAVVGKVFWTGAVAALGADDVHTGLQTLEDKDFVRRARRSSVEGEEEFAFRHILTRDVAYAQIPRARRAEKHVLAAQWIESLSPDRAEDRAEMLAYHYGSALELGRVAGVQLEGVAEGARFALRDAGDRASSLYAFPAAARFYGSALELWPEDRERPALLFRYGRAKWQAEAGGREELIEAQAGLVASGDLETAAEAKSALAYVDWMAGRRDEAFGHLQSGLELVQDLPASRAKVRLLSTLARYQALAGAAERSIPLAREAVELAEKVADDELRVLALLTLGTNEALESPIVAAATIEQAVDLARRANSAEIVRAYNNLAFAWHRAGHVSRAREALDASLEAAEQFGAVVVARFTRAGLALTYAYRAGRWDDVLLFADRFLAETADTSHYQESNVRRIRALILFARDDDAGALEDVRAALPRSRQVGDPQRLTPDLATCSRILLGAGLRDEAEALIDELLGLVQQKGYPLSSELDDVAVVLLALDRRGDLDVVLQGIPTTPWSAAARLYAEGDFGAAAAAYSDLGSRVEEAYSRLRAAESLAAEGRGAEAEEEAGKALAFYRTVGATRHIREAEALSAVSA
jgi:class 3 adenylate cyclase/tetratricopeptide (TPR) repeat protein